jgi:hypothetical protein
MKERQERQERWFMMFMMFMKSVRSSVRHTEFGSHDVHPKNIESLVNHW